MSAPLRVGAVAYSANVVPIWEGLKAYFADSAAPLDYVLYSNYPSQVAALLAGQIDIAWNTNLAFVRTLHATGGSARALASRDIDVEFQTVFVAARGSGLNGVHSLAGRRLALGSTDSAHAAILPLHYLAEAGIAPDQVRIERFNSDVGKHGDTGQSELDALQAVLHGEADVAAIGSTMWHSLGEGALSAGAFEPVWATEHYAHCAFTALDSLPAERTEPWVEHLLGMSTADPEQRRLLSLEGIRERWVSPWLAGYHSLIDAVRAQGVSAQW